MGVFRYFYDYLALQTHPGWIGESIYRQSFQMLVLHRGGHNALFHRPRLHLIIVRIQLLLHRGAVRLLHGVYFYRHA